MKLENTANSGMNSNNEPNICLRKCFARNKQIESIREMNTFSSKKMEIRSNFFAADRKTEHTKKIINKISPFIFFLVQNGGIRRQCRTPLGNQERFMNTYIVICDSRPDHSIRSGSYFEFHCFPDRISRQMKCKMQLKAASASSSGIENLTRKL